MMNLSSLSKAFHINIWLVLVSLGALALSLLTGGLKIYSWDFLLRILEIGGGGATLYFLSKAQRNVIQLIPALKKWRKGDLEDRIVNIQEKGDLGEVMCLINDLIDEIDTFIRDSSASMKAIKAGKYYRQIVLTGLVGGFKEGAIAINQGVQSEHDKSDALTVTTANFKENIKAILESVLQSTAAAQSHCSSLMVMSETSVRKSASVVQDVGSAQANVDYVASTAAHLSQSINKISAQVGEAKTVTTNAANEAQNATQTIGNLKEASLEINNIIKLISGIAGKTNLLALNATIEAARADQAGKGFAVVASEVKNLASQTVQATGQIASQINAIQSYIGDAVAAIEAINNTITHINSIYIAVSSAVEEQSSTTQEISHNMNEAAISTQNVSENIQDVKKIAETTHESANTVGESVNGLLGEIETLSKEISLFTNQITGKNKHDRAVSILH